jgi:hypothetical protein
MEIRLDTPWLKAQRWHGRNATASRSVFQKPDIGPFERPFLRYDAFRAKGNPMRTLVEPPPTAHCTHCGGELQLKTIEVANRTLDLENQILLCVKCGREHACTVNHNVGQARKVPGKAA